MARVPHSLLLALGQLADGSIWRVTLKSIAVSLVLCGAIAWAGWHALDWGMARAGLGDTLFSGAGGLRGALSLLLAISGLWLIWRIVAVAVIAFFADDVVLAVEAKHYPDAAAAARDLPVNEQFSAALRAARRALIVNLIALPFALALLVTGVGTLLLFWLVNAVLLGRELEEMIWLRHRRDQADLSPMGRWERFALGGAIAGLLLIPFVNFIAPVLGAAAAAHLIHRKT